MMDALFRRNLINAVLLDDHGITAARWTEWVFFRLPGGIGGFPLMDPPLLAAVLSGLVAATRKAPARPWFALSLSAGGLFSVAIHSGVLKKKPEEFDPPASKGYPWVTGTVSIGQMGMPLFPMTGGAYR